VADRVLALTQWLENLQDLGEFSIAPASDDASFRRYFRITCRDGRGFIAMDAPPEQEDIAPFMRVAEAFGRFGIHVPRVHAANPEQGFLLLSDLGQVQFLHVLDADSVERHYGDALGALVSIQACGPREELPPYTPELLLDEMELFRHWLLQRQLGIELTAADNRMLTAVFEVLVQNALEQPQVCVHRDYHSRNLMVSTPNPGVLDFQDAVWGPVTYDLASLLRDCYIAWPREQVKGWVQGYFELALQTGVVQDIHEDHFLRWFDLMGSQRHLKAAGIFARLNLRDGKPGYLKDIPRTLGYIVELAPEYSELAQLAGFLEQRVLPVLAQQTSVG
jgi:aminoglycoside/choline kinase family phosphotransferase